MAELVAALPRIIIDLLIFTLIHGVTKPEQVEVCGIRGAETRDPCRSSTVVTRWSVVTTISRNLWSLQFRTVIRTHMHSDLCVVLFMQKRSIGKCNGTFVLLNEACMRYVKTE